MMKFSLQWFHHPKIFTIISYGLKLLKKLKRFSYSDETFTDYGYSELNDAVFLYDNYYCHIPLQFRSAFLWASDCVIYQFLRRKTWYYTHSLIENLI
jgi:hypothetical protein